MFTEQHGPLLPTLPHYLPPVNPCAGPCGGQRPTRGVQTRLLLEELDGVADPDAAGLGDGRVHAEGQRLGRLELAAVGGERLQRVEVGDARVGVLGRDRAAADVALRDRRPPRRCARACRASRPPRAARRRRSRSSCGSAARRHRRRRAAPRAPRGTPSRAASPRRPGRGRARSRAARRGAPARPSARDRVRPRPAHEPRGPRAACGRSSCTSSPRSTGAATTSPSSKCMRERVGRSS